MKLTGSILECKFECYRKADKELSDLIGEENDETIWISGGIDLMEIKFVKEDIDTGQAQLYPQFDNSLLIYVKYDELLPVWTKLKSEGKR